MRRHCAALSILFLLGPVFQAAAEGHAAHGHSGFAGRPDAHAPIGVMGDHMHKAGGWMLSYRYDRMRMDGNRDGTRRVSSSEVVTTRGFAATPTDMDMEMHMFGLMVAPTDWLTTLLMLPYLRNSMDHITGMGGRFRTHSDGIGDLRLSGLLRVFENETQHVHLNLGLSFPTGRIQAKDDALTPGVGLTRITLPFPMQLGSGTFDWLPGVTYVGHNAFLSWGAQAMGTIRTGRNSAGWAAGNRVDVTSWVGVPWTKWLSTSLRVAYGYQGDFRGDELRPPTPAMLPTADPRLREGHRVDLLGGLNFYIPMGSFLGKHRLAIEAGGPLQQWLDGPQLETDWRVVVGWQKAF